MSYVIRHVYNKVHLENKNELMVITGTTGSGKSYTAMRFAELLDPTFNINRVVFTQEELTTLLKDGNLEKGSVIVWDEIGVNQSAKEWFEVTNKMINFVIQTFRNKNLIVICTSPNFNFVDSTTRNLFHSIVKCYKSKTGRVYGKYYEISVNDMTKKVYYKRLKGPGGVILDGFEVSMPKDSICKAYEDKAAKYKESVIVKAHAEVMAVKRKHENKNLNAHDLSREIMKDYERFIKMHGKRKIINKQLVEAHLGVGNRIATRVKMIVENDLKIKGLI